MLNFFKSGYQKIKKALAKTQGALTERVKALFGKPWDASTFDALEEILFEADLGADLAASLVSELKSDLRLKPQQDLNAILSLLKNHALEILQKVKTTPLPESKPLVILIIGVNGSGKTTSIAKLAHHFQTQGKKVLLAAADTFRAAAIDQLGLWAEKLQCEIIKAKPGSDPSAVVFDALSAAKSRQCDVVLIDTAGRLQNKTDLMEELKKIKNVSSKIIPDAPHATWILLDATTGQNALDQIKTFHTFTPISGIILSKLDGTAKGGIILPIYKTHQIPVLFIGTGETLEDLEPFDPMSYVEILFGQGEKLP